MITVLQLRQLKACDELHKAHWMGACQVSTVRSSREADGRMFVFARVGLAGREFHVSDMNSAGFHLAADCPDTKKAVAS